LSEGTGGFMSFITINGTLIILQNLLRPPEFHFLSIRTLTFVTTFVLEPYGGHQKTEESLKISVLCDLTCEIFSSKYLINIPEKSYY